MTPAQRKRQYLAKKKAGRIRRCRYCMEVIEQEKGSTWSGGVSDDCPYRPEGSGPHEPGDVPTEPGACVLVSSPTDGVYVVGPFASDEQAQWWIKEKCYEPGDFAEGGVRERGPVVQTVKFPLRSPFEVSADE